MQVMPINNNAVSFGALKITPEAKALIERERGGKSRIKRYTKELENSIWDLNIKKLDDKSIYPYFGSYRATCVIPSRYEDEYVMVYSSEVGGDNDDDIVDCLKFSSAKRAKEVYETLKAHFFNSKTPLQHLDWDVYAMKAFTEAEIVPQTESPWAHFLKKEKPIAVIRPEVSATNELEIQKQTFSQRLSTAWKVLCGK